MKTPRFNATCPLLTIVAISSFAMAQNAAPNEQQTRERQSLEKRLAELDATITEVPSPQHHQRAGIRFRLGRFEEAIQDYDKAAEGGNPHTNDSCWERGLAHYYAGNFQAGAEQFARYHRVGSLDIENGLWHFLCTAEEAGIETARERLLIYPRKLRPPFPDLLALYTGEGDTGAVFNAAEAGKLSNDERTERRFYAHYYVAKFHELNNEMDRARKEMDEALKHKIPHFMYTCAKIDRARLAESGE